MSRWSRGATRGGCLAIGIGCVLLLPFPSAQPLLGMSPFPHARAAPAADSLIPLAEVIRLMTGDDTRAEGIRAMTLRAEALRSEEATPWIHLLTVVRDLGIPAGALATRAVGLAEGGGTMEGAALIVNGVDREIPEADRAALLAIAAHLLDPLEPERSAQLRRRVLAEWPDSSEAPEAQLRLARHLLLRGGQAGILESVSLLEAFLLDRPDHPLAPEARRLRLGAIQRLSPPLGGMRE
jgi:hypothetical protein